jgi:hypothetical protein
MKIIPAILLLTAILVVSFAPVKSTDPLNLYSQIDHASAPNTLSKAEKTNGWNLLFDGETTSGWHGYNLKSFPDCWTVENGILTTITKTGNESQDITTDKTYRSFALSIDFKVAKASNSGIIYNVKEDPKYKYSYETGPEVQIMDLKPDQKAGLQSLGANYGMYVAKPFPVKQTGEWNNLMLIVDGDHITQIMNGVIAVEFDRNTPEWKKLKDTGKWKDYPDYGKYAEGKIDLQNHGTPIWFRNIKLKELK